VRILLAGANPGVTLTRDGEPTVFASIWVVDWSVRGAGTAIVLWHNATVRILTARPELGEWLEHRFVRHFPEVSGLSWARPEVQRADVTAEIDLAGRVGAAAGDVEITMSGVLDRRLFATDDFRLDGVPHSLTLLLAPMRAASVTIAGRPVPGQVAHSGTPDRPSSSAFATTAEVWSGPLD